MFLTLITLFLSFSETNHSYFLENISDQIIATKEASQNSFARAIYQGNFKNDGFKKFDYIVLKPVSNLLQMKAYGFAEGYMMPDDINDYMHNVFLDQKYQFKHEFPNEQYQQYVSTQLDYIKKNINNDLYDTEQEKQYWSTIMLSMQWLDGLMDGFNNGSSSVKVEIQDLYYLQSITDYQSLIEKLFPGDFHSQQDFNSLNHHRGHCSALIYLTPDCSDVFFGHNTWTGYLAGFNRVMKSVSLKLNLITTQQQRVTYSSYPGAFFSVDDFYQVYNQKTDGSFIKTAIFETTILNWNTSLPAIQWENSTQTWMRAMLACYVLASPLDFTNFFIYNMSATYNNNYMLFDYSLYQQAKDECVNCSVKALRSKLKATPYILYALEAADSGMQWNADITQQFFTVGYYGSFNAPKDELLWELYNYSSSNEFQNGSSRNCTAFNRLYLRNVSFDNFSKLMRHNQYLTDFDGCQYNQPRVGMASRYDLCNTSLYDCIDPDTLIDEGPIALGATDAKVTNQELMNQFQFKIIIGVTPGTDSEGPFPGFDFDEFFKGTDFEGQVHGGVIPTRYDAEYITVSMLACANRDKNCNLCNSKYVEKDGLCEKEAGNLGLVLGIALPIGFLMFAAVVGLNYCLSRKQQYQKPTEQE